MKNYDIIVVGGGPGGYVAAIKGAQLGAKVALIEKEVVGGICLNHGCIPTKAIIKSAKTYKSLKSVAEFGITNSGEVGFDWSAIIKRKNGIVKQLTGGVAFLLKKNGVDVYNGYAEVISGNEVKVNDENLKTKNVIIATGASAIIPPIPGVKEAYENKVLVTSKELLQIETAPKNLVIIGGGVIGIEFAAIFNSFGSKVTIIEKMETILPSMDADVRAAYAKRLKADGIDVLTKAEVKSVNQTKVTYLLDGVEQTIDSSLILMAVGTKANLFGVEKLNLKVERGNIITNEYLQTNLPNVYAIGDVNGKYMLAHVASHEGIIAVEHILKKGHNKMRYDRIPSCVYGSPEIAAIGLTEDQVKEHKIEYKVSKIPLAAVGKALCDGEKEGFIKLIVDKKHLEVLGCHIYAYNATELIAEFAVAMEAEATAHTIAHAIHPHPTLSELSLEAALAVIDKAIHI